MRSLRSTIATAAAGIAVLASTVALAACSPGTVQATTPSADTTTLTTAWPADVATLDPAAVSTDQDKELTMNIYQRLMEYAFTEGDDGTLVWDGLAADPSLAASYTESDTSITFTLRDEVSFHGTGNPLTAEDVRYSYERAFASGGASDLNNGGLYSPDQIVVDDDETVTFNFTDVTGSPVPVSDALLATVRMPNFGIVDSVEVKSHATDEDPYAANWLATNYAGTGPYYIADRKPGEELTLEAVPDLWSGEPAYSTVTVRVVNNGSISSLLTGGAVQEALFGLTQNDLNSLESSGFTVDHQATPDFIYLMLPEGNPASPFDDVLVRQAVAYALPYDQIVSSVYFDRAERSLSYVNLKAPGYTDAWAQYDTDLDKAQDLMTQAGSPSIEVTMTYSNSEPTYEDTALLIQDQLKKIGITVTLKPQTPAEMFGAIMGRASAESAEAADSGAPAIALFNLSIYLDDPKSPVSFYSRTGGPLNYGRLSDPDVDELQDANQFAALTPEREAAYEQIQQLVADDASFIPLAVTGRTVVTAPGITGVSYSPEIGVRFWLLKPAA